MEKKKRGRPKFKKPYKQVTINLTLDTIEKLRIMTTFGRNASAFIEALICRKFTEVNQKKETIKE